MLSSSGLESDDGQKGLEMGGNVGAYFQTPRMCGRNVFRLGARTLIRASKAQNLHPRRREASGNTSPCGLRHQRRFEGLPFAKLF